jgi:hypothetical protein
MSTNEIRKNTRRGLTFGAGLTSVGLAVMGLTCSSSLSLAIDDDIPAAAESVEIEKPAADDDASKPAEDEAPKPARKTIKKPVAKTIDLPNSTHKQIGDIKVRGERSGHQLQTFCLDSKGNILAVVAAPRPYGTKLEGKNNTSEIRMFDGEGQPLREWPVDFAVQAIAVSPGGTIFVSGNGKIAKYDHEGKELAVTDLPHLGRLLNNSDALREEAEAQIEDQKQQFQAQAKELQEQADEKKKKVAELKEAMEEKDKDSITASEKRKLRTAEMAVRALENQIKALGRSSGPNKIESVEDIVEGMISRLKISNALAASDKDVFVASGVLKGYGYAIWRITHDFAEPKQIVTGLSGCCGQMDIHCCGEDVYAAENSRKSVLRFDREGKKIASFGKGERNGGSGAGFGGCCNPMNLCFTSSGNVLTAESEGYIKEFSKDGTFKGILGQAKVSGGCKNVALALSPDGNRAYFFDLQGSRIVILGKKEASDGDESKPKAEENENKVSKVD